MRARDYKMEDKTFVKSLCDQHSLDLPPFYSIARVIDNVGAGIIIPCYEVHLMLDMTLPKRVRAGAFTELFAAGIFASRQVGIEEWLAFPYDPEFRRVLLKHGFKELNESPLRLEV